MIDLDASELAELCDRYLERQAWFQHVSPHDAHKSDLARLDVLLDGPPGLARLWLRRRDRIFQVLVGFRPPGEIAHVLRGEGNALFGSLDVDGQSALAYDALADDALCIELLAIATGGFQSARFVRRVSSLASHASLVFDERLFMKCYRVLEDGERPEIEVLTALDLGGFNALLAPMGRWREHGMDLALVREFLPSALEGRQLALTSLRDVLAYASTGEEVPDPILAPVPSRRDRRNLAPEATAAAAGGDLASEMERLGQTTARLHLALARAFGEEMADASALVTAARQFSRDEAPAFSYLGDYNSLGGLADVLARAGGHAGRSIRRHGEYQLRRVMRSDVGWILAGFSDDPLYEASSDSSLKARVGSPLEDLADMCFSLGVVAREALIRRPKAETTAEALALAWCRRNREAFLGGYFATTGIASLLPEADEMRTALLAGYEQLREQRYDATLAA